ncbi:hypothetical protein SLS57_001800 [Botryosphaeria dothidea]
MSEMNTSKAVFCDFSNGQVDECLLTLCARTYTGFKVTTGTVHPGTLTTQDLEYVSYVNSASDLEKRQYGIQYRIFRGGPDGSNYTLNSNDLSSTATMLAAIFTTDLAEGVSQPAGFEGGDTVDVSRVLHSTGDLGRLMANTTRAMTDFVMGVNASRVEGQAWKEETFVEVHWPWFVLPAALVALAVGLLGVCVGEG